MRPGIPDESNDLMNELTTLFSTLTARLPSSTSLLQYLEVDSGLEICGTHTDSEIIAAASESQSVLKSSNDESEPECVIPEPPHPREARAALTLLRSFVTSRPDALSAMNSLNSVEDFLDLDSDRSKKQSSLNDYFFKNN